MRSRLFDAQINAPHKLATDSERSHSPLRLVCTCKTNSACLFRHGISFCVQTIAMSLNRQVLKRRSFECKMWMASFCMSDGRTTCAMFEAIDHSFVMMRYECSDSDIVKCISFLNKLVLATRLFSLVRGQTTKAASGVEQCGRRPSR